MTVDANAVQHSGDAAEQARAWVVRLRSGVATVADVDAFRRWRAADAANEQAYRDVVLLWERLGPAMRPNAGQAAPARAPLAALAARSALSRRSFFAGAGAAAVIAVGLPVGLMLPSVPAGATVLETRKGERRRETLADGVVVELNTDTRVVSWTEADGPARRRLRLDRGEALLTVAYGARGALWARADDTEVVAREAQFLLRWTQPEPQVLCLSGSVEVLRQGNRLRLAGAQALEAEGAGPVADPNAALEWRRGVLVFENRRAAEVVSELNRYRPGRVVLPEGHGDVRISGVIHLDRADAAVDHVARSLGLKAYRYPAGYVVLRD